ncbi:MAG: phosphatase domain-containing protein [Bacteroidota bacterium]
MSKWSSHIRNLLVSVENRFDALNHRIRSRLGSGGPPHVLIYHGYPHPDGIFLRGRVIRDRAIEVTTEDGTWNNLVNSYKRMNSAEIPGAEVNIAFYDQRLQTTADHEGYWEITLPRPTELPGGPGRYQACAELLSPDEPNKMGGEGPVYLPGSNPRFGVVSDIDDTILVTGATSIRTMARLTFLQNVHNREAFPGTATFYHALQAGASGAEGNPIFYVSSSPWNLYDMLRDFVNLQGIPEGPLILRDYGLEEESVFSDGHSHHKLRWIQHILDSSPHLPFILIGDSGQQDTFIYYELAQKYPDRILSIYIRDVKSPKTENRVRSQIEKARAEGIDMIWMPDSTFGMEDALKKGYLRKDKL